MGKKFIILAFLCLLAIVVSVIFIFRGDSDASHQKAMVATAIEEIKENSNIIEDIKYGKISQTKGLTDINNVEVTTKSGVIITAKKISLGYNKRELVIKADKILINGKYNISAESALLENLKYNSIRNLPKIFEDQEYLDDIFITLNNVIHENDTQRIEIGEFFKNYNTITALNFVDESTDENKKYKAVAEEINVFDVGEEKQEISIANLNLIINEYNLKAEYCDLARINSKDFYNYLKTVQNNDLKDYLDLFFFGKFDIENFVISNITIKNNERVIADVNDFILASEVVKDEFNSNLNLMVNNLIYYTPDKSLGFKRVSIPSFNYERAFFEDTKELNEYYMINVDKLFDIDYFHTIADFNVEDILNKEMDIKENIMNLKVLTSEINYYDKGAVNHFSNLASISSIKKVATETYLTNLPFMADITEKDKVIKQISAFMENPDQIFISIAPNKPVYVKELEERFNKLNMILQVNDNKPVRIKKK